MSKFDFPELPSDEELGITDEDRNALGEELPADRPELSKDEMMALLGESSAPPSGPDAGAGDEGKREKKKKKKKEKAAKAAPAGGTHAESGPRSRWRGPLTLAILVGVAALASTRSALPRPVPANASDTVFSSARAMSTLVEIARRPHPIGSPEHARIREFLMARLRELGLEPEIQTASSVVQLDDRVRAATVRNIVARLPGTASTGAILITAHYDTGELAPGAGDDGTGVVAILEALRALRTGPPLRNDVIVLISDGEEIGMFGARAFVDQHPWIGDVSVVLSFDMRGAGGPSIMFETNDENGWIVRALQRFDAAPFANSMFAEVYTRMPNGTDFTPFRGAGKQGLNFAAIGNAHVYHQPTDTPERLSEATLQHHGMRALAALRYLGGADLRAVDAPDVVHFTVPLLGLVVYDGGWVLPITGGLALLLVVVGLVAWRRGARPVGLAAGLVVALLGAGLAYGAARALLAWLPRFHPEAGSLSAALYHHEGWYVVGLVAAVFALVTALHAAARRWLSPVELALGAIVVPFGLAVWASFVAPLAAMNAQWPVAAALIAVLVLALLPSRSRGVVAWIATLLLAVPVLVFFVPLSELLWLSMTLRALGVVAVVVALMLQLALPALDSLRHPNGWWTPLTGIAVVAAALWLGGAASDPGVDDPAPSTLLYAFDHGTDSAYWVTDPAADLVLDEEAIAWAEARASAPFATTLDVTPFGLRWNAAPVAEAPALNVEPPEVLFLRDTVEAGVRRVTLGARSRIGAERLTFLRDPGTRTRFLSVDGTPIAQPGAVAGLDHWGVPDSLVVLELDTPAGEPIGVHVLEDHLRPAELLGAAAFSRPDGLAPDVSTGSDRAILRYSLATPADPRGASPAVTLGAGGLPVAASAAPARPDSTAADSATAGPPR